MGLRVPRKSDQPWDARDKPSGGPAPAAPSPQNSSCPDTPLLALAGEHLGFRLRSKSAPRGHSGPGTRVMRKDPGSSQVALQLML